MELGGVHGPTNKEAYGNCYGVDCPLIVLLVPEKPSTPHPSPPPNDRQECKTQVFIESRPSLAYSSE